MWDIVLTKETESSANIDASNDLMWLEIHYLKLKSINMDDFKHDNIKSGLPHMHHDDLDTLEESSL